MPRSNGYAPLKQRLRSDFVARAGGAASTSGAWTGELDNYRLSFASYDDNGNILSLRRRGLLAPASRVAPKRFGPVDHLTYAYLGNRLQAVDDNVTGNQLPRPTGYEGAPTSLAGDFQEGGTRLGQEYLYDANGNLTQDRNKGISGIAYNHLNLPRQIHFGQGADSLVFRYTAAGQKVAKLVYQTGKPAVRTDYLGPYQYEQDSLRFFPHAEGRVLRAVSASSGQVRYAREFTFKDHLGNLRLAYRLGQRLTYSAGLEPGDAGRETRQFDSLSVSPPVAHYTGPAGANTARTGSYVARLNAGGPAPQPLGPLAQLAVQKGDTVTVTAPGHYPQAVSHSSFAFSLASFVASLRQPAPGAPAGPDGRRGGLPLLSLGVSAGLPALTQLGGGVPKGYVRLLVFDADSNLVSSQTQQLSPAAHTGYEALTVQIIAPSDGYVTAYVGNESNADVYFDDITVVHGQGLQVQENQYDPFGLDLAGVSGAAPGLCLKNGYQFNGKENQLDLGLNWNHQDARFYDYQLGRWHSGDPLANRMTRWSPYTFSFDNPLRYQDANGQFPWPGFIIAFSIWYTTLEAKLSHHSEVQNAAMGALIRENSGNSNGGNNQFLGNEREFAQPTINPQALNNLGNAAIVAEEVGHKTADVTVGVGRPVANALEGVGAAAEVAGVAGALLTEGGTLPLVPTGEALGKVGGAMNKTLDVVEGNNSHVAEDILYDKGKGMYFDGLNKALDGAQSAGAMTKTERAVLSLPVKALEKSIDAARDLQQTPK